MKTEKISFRTFLQRELERRSGQNSRYSLRAFARDLGISAPRLSHLLNGTQGMSRKYAENIGSRLGLNVEEISRFCDLAESEHARCFRDRLAAQKRLETYQTLYTEMQLDSFRVISEWYHLAILELTTTTGFKSEVTWIAKKLGISIHETKAAIERLKSLGALEEKRGRLHAAASFKINAAGAPSENVRRFHKSILEKAIQAVDLQTVDERELGTTMMAIDSRRIPEAKERLRRFRQKFSSEFSPLSDSKDLIYCLAVQFFRLQTTEPYKKEEN